MPTLEQFESEGCAYSDFQQGTRWSGGLAEAEIEEIEHRLTLQFPPDYRLFLRYLHSTDRPMVKARFIDDMHMVLEPDWALTNWQVDKDPIQTGLGWLLDGFVFDVEMAGLWKQAWGLRPATKDARRRRVAEVLAAAPRLIPIYGHRYLVGEPCQARNPVLSIIQSDVVAYGADLRQYLIADFGNGRLGDFDSGYEAARKIPFWGEFVC